MTDTLSMKTVLLMAKAIKRHPTERRVVVLDPPLELVYTVTNEPCLVDGVQKSVFFRHTGTTLAHVQRLGGIKMDWNDGWFVTSSFRAPPKKKE